MITKVSYRDQIKGVLLERMKSGSLRAGDSISLAELSRELQVSVTPIREALTQLEQSGIIVSIPNRGFIVSSVDRNEVEHLYKLVACLEALAIENSPFDPLIIDKLKTQQEIFENTDTPMDRINADMVFHEILTSGYKNPISGQILKDLKIRIFFYELDFMKEHGFYKDSEHHHHQIINSLESGNVRNVVKSVKKNWLQILDYE